MAQWLKQGTTVIMVGPFLKTSDGYTLATKCTLSTAKVKLSKNDAVFVNKASTKGSSYSAHGQYRIFLTTVDSGTPGRLRVSALDTKCLPVWENYMVVSENPYDSLITATDVLDVKTGGIVNGAAFSDLQFLMVGSSDHYTGKTGLTVTAYVGKDGATFSTVKGSVAEVANGIYQFDASTGDMSGNVLTFKFSAAGADDTFVTIKTVEH